MANNDIEQKIILKGEKEYRAALQDANRNLKTLRSELKLETAELGKNATEQQKAEAKVKSLKKQIEEQKKVVDTYKKALDEVKERYPDNEAAIAKWEIKLNDAKTTLANMKNEVEGVGTSFKKIESDAAMGTVAANSFAQAFSGLSSIGDSVSSAIEDVFTGMITRITQAVGELWGLITDTAAKANNWTDLANYYGSTAEEVQLMDRAIVEAGGDFGKFSNIMAQLTFGGKNQKIAEWFGVSDAKYTNNLEYTMAVLRAMEEKYKEWGTGGKWDQAMSEVFGAKKSADVSWFVTNLDTIIQKRDELSEGGYLMDEDELSTMNDVYVELQTIEDRWDALKAKFATGFGQITLDIMTNVQGALDALAKYFDAETPEEREEALQELERNIKEAFERMAQAIRDGLELLGNVAEELKQSDDPVVKALGELLGKLVEALKWFTEDNANNLIKALEIIAGFWITGKGLSMVTKIGELATHLMTIKTYSGITNLLNGGAGAAGAAGGGGLLGGIGTAFAGVGLLYPLVHKFLHWGEENDALTEFANSLYATPLSGRSTISTRIGEEALRREELANTPLIPMPEETFNLTPEQLAAAEAFWDVWRTGDDEHFDSAYENFQNAFSGDTNTFERLDSTMDKLMEVLDKDNHTPGANMEDFTDLPSTWFKVNADWWKTGGNENGVTRQDLNNLNTMPDKVGNAIKTNMNGIKVQLDGRTVGNLVAPYVSQYIARYTV